MAFVELLGIEMTKVETECVEAFLPITEDLLQPHGFVHGGVTLSLLETIASRGAQERANLEIELPFGTYVQVEHVKSVQEGRLWGSAVLESEELATGGTKQLWQVAAFDDNDELISHGVVETRIVSLEYLQSKTSSRA